MRRLEVFLWTGGVLPALLPTWVIPVLLVSTTAPGLAIGFAFGRPQKQAAAPVAVSVPVRGAASPGQRVQRAPPKREM